MVNLLKGPTCHGPCHILSSFIIFSCQLGSYSRQCYEEGRRPKCCENFISLFHTPPAPANPSCNKLSARVAVKKGMHNYWVPMAASKLKEILDGFSSFCQERFLRLFHIILHTCSHTQTYFRTLQVSIYLHYISSTRRSLWSQPPCSAT